MSKKETAKRYILFIIGLFFSAMGVALTKRGELGISPISSVANVLNARFGGISIGTFLIIWNCLLIVGQILVLRKSFRPIQLLQVPLSFLFGWFTDFGVWLVHFIPVPNYAVRLLLVILGTAVLGFGIALAVIADAILNSGEAFVKAVADTTHKEFGNVKICFDIACVLTALVLSLLFFHGRVVGMREGTVIAALLTGTMFKIFVKPLRSPLGRVLTDLPLTNNSIFAKITSIAEVRFLLRSVHCRHTDSAGEASPKCMDPCRGRYAGAVQNMHRTVVANTEHCQIGGAHFVSSGTKWAG